MQTHFRKGQIPLNTPPLPTPRDRKRPRALGRALGVGGGVGCSGVFHLFSKCVWKCQIQVFKMSKCPESRCSKYQIQVWGKCPNANNPGFSKCTKTWICVKSGFSKFRDFIRDAECHLTSSQLSHLQPNNVWFNAFELRGQVHECC